MGGRGEPGLPLKGSQRLANDWMQEARRTQGRRMTMIFSPPEMEGLAEISDKGTPIGEGLEET